MSASWLLAAYQDVRDRWVSDYVWVPAFVGGALLLLRSVGPLLALLVIKIAGLVVLSYAWRRLGLMADADAIGFPLITLSRNLASPLPELITSLVVALVYITAARLKHGGFEKTMSPDEALRQNVWIPKKVVNVRTREVRELRGRPEEAWESLKKYSGSREYVVVSGYGVPLVAFFGMGYVVTRALEALLGNDVLALIVA